MMLVANGLPVLTMRLLIPWTGVWSAELQLDGEALPPTGPVAIVGDGVLLQGSVDPERSGMFGDNLTLTVLGGSGGWEKLVRPKHYHSAGAVPLATVVTTTAAEVGEPPPVCEPATVGGDYVRVAGPASQVLADRQWHVGLDGVTVVGPRLPRPQPLELSIHNWNVTTGAVQVGCETIIEPGTVLVSPLFGSRVVRDVELVVSVESVDATLWTVTEAPQSPSPLALLDALQGIARAAVRPEYLRYYECRVIGMSGDNVDLQPTVRIDGCPEIIPAPVWAGASGVKAELAPGSLVLLGFRSGDPTRPYVAAFEPADGPGWMPIELELDAKAQVTIAKTAAAGLAVGEGSSPVALAPDLTAWAAQVVLQCAANVPPIVIPPLSPGVSATKLRSS